jgi:hypothetical protein
MAALPSPELRSNTPWRPLCALWLLAVSLLLVEARDQGQGVKEEKIAVYLADSH